MRDQWIAVVICHTSGFLPPPFRADTHVLIHGLQLTFPVLGTSGTVCRVGRQDELHGHLPYLRRHRAVDGDLHPLSYFRLTCRDCTFFSLNLYGTQSAAPFCLQVRMTAQMRDKHSRIERSIQNTLAFPCFNLFTVNSYLHIGYHPLIFKIVQLCRRIFSCDTPAVQTKSHRIAGQDEWIAVAENIAGIRSHAV